MSKKNFHVIRLCGLSFLFFLIPLLAFAQEKPIEQASTYFTETNNNQIIVSSNTHNEQSSFHFQPTIGYSYITGLIGFELQYKHFAVAVGLLPYNSISNRNYGLSGGLKYYVKPNQNSFYFSIGNTTALHNSGFSNNTSSVSVLLIGYCFKLKNSLNSSIGTGISHHQGGTPGPIPDYPIELSFSYSF